MAKKAAASEEGVQSDPTEIAPGEFNSPRVSCLWCQEPTTFEFPEEEPPAGMQYTVECENCGKQTPVPDVMFRPITATGLDIEEEE